MNFFIILVLCLVGILSYCGGRIDQKRTLLENIKLYSPIQRHTTFLPRGQKVFKTDKEYDNYVQIFNDTKQDIIRIIEGG